MHQSHQHLNERQQEEPYVVPHEELNLENYVRTSPEEIQLLESTEQKQNEVVCSDPRGTYRNPVNCSEFYQCVAGIPYRRSCPDTRTYFNPECNCCDWKANVPGCHVPLVQLACPEPHGMYADPANCQQFYQCLNGVAQHFHECPAGTRFSSTLGLCDWAHNVQCIVN